MKKNVTIRLDDDTARWVRVEAARRGVSVSLYLAEVLGERRSRVRFEAPATISRRAKSSTSDPAPAHEPEDLLHDSRTSGNTPFPVHASGP